MSNKPRVKRPRTTPTTESRNLKLGPMDMLAVQELMPEKGNRIIMNLVDGIRQKVSFDAADMKRWQITAGPSKNGVGVNYNWPISPALKKLKSVTFDKTEWDLLNERAKKCDEEGEVTAQTLNLINLLRG